jgi:hypothetical protein
MDPSDLILGDIDKVVILTAAEIEPNAHSPSQLANFVLNESWDQQFFDWWLPQQREWQKRAETVMLNLQVSWPLPTHSEIVGGNSSIPAWSIQWWAKVLLFPWAARLGEAVESAEAWELAEPKIYR